MVSQPCVVCGDETAANSVRYSSRRVATRPDGTLAFLCADCLATTNPEARHALSEAELLRLRENAFLFGVAFGASAH